MTDEQRPGTYEQLSEQECLELLSTTTVGRVGFASDRGQQIIPVNFDFTGGAVLFRTDSTSVVGPLAEGVDDVAFEVDHHDDMYQVGWSVLLVGRTEATPPDEGPSDRRAPWAPGDRRQLVRLVPSSISGRRVSGH